MSVQKFKINEPVKPKSSAALDRWTGANGGLACGSSLLPQWIAELQEVDERSGEILLENCFVECTTLPVREVITDSYV
jgi:hypothetical protein